ncbi:MAG: hypothetical protein IJK26_09005 [Clostridia bacterium]|nr:hypothetical protein [Clostridia bacterium]
MKVSENEYEAAINKAFADGSVERLIGNTRDLNCLRIIQKRLETAVEKSQALYADKYEWWATDLDRRLLRICLERIEELEDEQVAKRM